MTKSITALLHYLLPLEPYFNDIDVQEVIINKPKEIWVERKGDIQRYEIEALDFNYLRSMASLVAESTEQVISEERPLLSATLPNGYRIQIVIPPCCPMEMIAYSIRKPAAIQFELADYEKMGAFENISVKEVKDNSYEILNDLLEKKDISNFLKTAVNLKKNIIISGGTSTGKTTFTNTIINLINHSERLITIEDSREIKLPKHLNSLHLLASKGGQGRANVTMQDLLESCLRLRPDRIILGELRGSEAFTFLRAINTGHPGSVSTLHADSTAGALNQLKMMVMQAGLNIPTEAIEKYIATVVDILIQLKRVDNKRVISEVRIMPK
jgi:type IV secretion system protein VirB11